MKIKDKVRAAILGLVIGDALGVPVEFKSRIDLQTKPVTDMIGYGTYSQPAGTWSDDSSMMLATMEWLCEMKNISDADFSQLMDKFSDWLQYGDYTPYGDAFDCGISVHNALMKYYRGAAPLDCGGIYDQENGNGSLMRILPVPLSIHESLTGEHLDHVDFIYQCSQVTHAHAKSKLACLIYSKCIVDLMNDFDNTNHKQMVVQKALDQVYAYVQNEESDTKIQSELNTYKRIWDTNFLISLSEDKIKSTGYVVDTLEAALWCFLTTDSYRECVLKAVNLGSDTDTVAAVAGGLAGVFYGMEAIPSSWITILAKENWIEALIERMIAQYF